MYPTALTFLLLLPITAAVCHAQSPLRTNRNAPLPIPAACVDVCCGDVDADGDPDLVLANATQPDQLLLNDGRGGFVDATAGRLVTPAANRSCEVDLADLDGDGDLDLIVANELPRPSRVYSNNGSGTFTDVTATALPGGSEFGLDQVVADLDGDGDADWLVLGYGGRLLRNDGSGVFTLAPAGSLPGFLRDDGGAFAADLDLDGDLDVVTGWPGPHTALVLANQGNGVFTVAASIGYGNAHAADADGDGDLDLFVGYGRYLMSNLGALSFAAPIDLGQTTVASLDFDADGDPDLLGLDLLVNDGTGSFAPIAHATPIDAGSQRVVDLDGDGDPDTLSARSAGSATFDFFTQVHTPSAPVRGAPYSIRLTSPVRATPVVWGLAIANGQGVATIPGFAGVLRLDPSTAVLLAPIFATTGLATITWTIPNVPAVIGLELHHQAVVLDPLRPPFLTNAVRDVVF